MKVFLEFNLPEEEFEYGEAVDGHKTYRVLRDLDIELRYKFKYGLGDLDKASPVEVLEWVRGKLHGLLADRGVDLWS